MITKWSKQDIKVSPPKPADTKAKSYRVDTKYKKVSFLIANIWKNPKCISWIRMRINEKKTKMF